MQNLRRTIALFSAFAAFALVGGCAATDVTAAPEEVFVAVTDRAEYQRIDGLAPVTVLLRNRGSHVVEVVGCPEPPGLMLERRVDGQWSAVSSTNVVCPAVHLLRSVRLDPGAELTGQLLVAASGELRVRVFVGPLTTSAMSPSVTTPAFTVR
jgi:hypothetical protein